MRKYLFSAVLCLFCGSLKAQFLSRTHGGTNLFQPFVRSFELTGEYSLRKNLAIHTSIGFTANSSGGLCKAEDDVTARKHSGAFLKAGPRLYLFRTFWPGLPVDYFFGVSGILSYSEAEGSIGQAAFREKGVIPGIALIQGYTFGNTSRITADLGFQMAFFTPPFTLGTDCKNYHPGLGSAGFLAHLNLKYRLK